MKGFNSLLVFLFGITFVFAQENSNSVPVEQTADGTYYGALFNSDKLQEKKEVWRQYNNMTASDTITLQFKSKVKEVCKMKGCWMVVELPDGEQAMVRFKDYGFFMPFDIEEKEVVLNGLAFVEEMSVEDQKHFAKDGGKTADEISKITTPKRTYSFEASGVFVSK